MAEWNPARFTDVGLSMLVIIALFNLLRDIFPEWPLYVVLVGATISWIAGSIILHGYIHLIQNKR